MRRKIILATFGYFVTTFVFAVIWHMGLFHEYYFETGAYNRPEPIFPLGIGSILIQGYIIVYLFQFYRKGERPFREGTHFALIMGLFLYTLSTITFAAKVEVGPLPNWFLMQFAFHLIQFLLAGAVLGFVFIET